MRNKFDKQLSVLNRELTAMGGLCEDAISNAARALTLADVSPDAVFDVETDIKEKEREIESLCLKLLLQQQPVARDLRQISSALKMITDMERIGNQAADIAEIIKIGNVKGADGTLNIGGMAKATTKMVTESIDAFVNQDIHIAETVIEYDHVVDELFCDIKNGLVSFLASGADSEYAMDLLMIAKYFERIGDHAVNIAEWVVFSITGTHKGD